MSERIDHHCAKQGTISCKLEHNAKLSLTRLPLIRRGTHRTRPSWALGSGLCLWNLASTVSCWRLKCSGATGGRCGSGIRLLNSWFIDELISRERCFCLFILVQQSVKSFVHLTLSIYGFPNQSWALLRYPPLWPDLGVVFLLRGHIIIVMPVIKRIRKNIKEISLVSHFK